MTASRHSSEERLLAYAAGTLSPPEAVVVAVHLALRPASDAWVRQLQAIGGALLDEETPAPLSPDALQRALARIEAAAPVPSPPTLSTNEMPELPEPLRRYGLGPWRWVGPGVRLRDVHAPRDGGCRVILLKVQPGHETPVHTHSGAELTCVLSGAYANATRSFDVGDLEEADPTVQHEQRVVSNEPCLCVVALDGQIRMRGWLARLWGLFVRL